MAAKGPKRRRRDDALGSGADAHQAMGARTSKPTGNGGLDVPITNGFDPGACGTDLGDQVLVPGPIHDNDDQLTWGQTKGLTKYGDVFSCRLANIHLALGSRRRRQFFHVEIWSVEESTPVGCGQHRHRTILVVSTQVGAFAGVYSEINARTGTAAHFLTDIKHGGFVPLPFTNDDTALHLDLPHPLAHRLDSRSISLVFLAQAGQMGRGNGGLFNDLKNFLDEGAIHNGRAGDRGLAEKKGSRWEGRWEPIAAAKQIRFSALTTHFRFLKAGRSYQRRRRSRGTGAKNRASLGLKVDSVESCPLAPVASMSTKPLVISPSILSADFSRLGEDVRAVDAAGADWIHVDVMDGRFVPNITIGPLIVEALRPVTTKPLDVHLMIVEPEKYVADFAKAGADIISVQVEACPHLHRNLAQIKDLGKLAGAVLNPSTPLDTLEYCLELCDLVLIMSVNPGFGGQSFIENQVQKIRELRRICNERGLDPWIEVDGGIKASNAWQVIEAGANAIVSGSGVFNQPSYAEAITGIRNSRRPQPALV